MTVTEAYIGKQVSGLLRADAEQAKAIAVFQRLQDQLLTGSTKQRNGFRGLLSGRKPSASPKGLYFYGGVGRGKSMLMDLFFDSTDIKQKRRVHFHAFMQDVHETLHKARASGVEDAISPVAAEVARNTRLLCFDEMQISDITDAMIVGRLFEHLFKAGVVIVTTSNRAPDDLYKDGLNRDLFLPFIDLIKQRLEIYNLDSDTDHRQNRLAGHRSYFSPNNEAAEMAVSRIWNELTGGVSERLVLKHKSRDIVLDEFHNGIARACFRDLCSQPLGPGDYLEIAKALRVLILTDIPRLDRSRNNEAKRFVTLIDTLYEARIKLIATAEAAPESLYAEGRGAFEFERTASRLAEMQSDEWVNSGT